MKIAAVGGYGVGMTMTVPHFPSAGETVSHGLYSAGPGGKGSNQAIAAARLGAEVELLTAIGRDHAADDALTLWRDEGVGSGHVARMDAPTMVGFIFVDDAGENEIAIAPGALELLTPAHVEAFRDVVREADLVVVSLEISPEAASAALRVAHEEGTRTLLNPAPVTVLPEEIWDWIDIITPNQSEAALLLGLDDAHDLDPTELLRRLRQKTAATIVLTLGAGGCAVMTDETPRVLAPYSADRVVDTTGAGDAFTAALAVAVTEGLPIDDAVRFASAAGAHAVTRAGVIDALPTRADIDRIMRSQNPQN
ncbi:ribokinase [Microbacterium sp. W4I4]|uniref:ribokinase n=1 Tax=Microbacterium sp. W4I4 TaxID=3042295 RepID=UPI00278038A8|nr:ribokinase [Microbacterium sp. W4I4]MDQ0614058.1 ribokinase [Microbacterium sp. W4I4]